MTRCRTETRTYHLPDDERMHYVLGNGRGLCRVVTWCLTTEFEWRKVRTRPRQTIIPMEINKIVSNESNILIWQQKKFLGKISDSAITSQFQIVKPLRELPFKNLKLFFDRFFFILTWLSIKDYLTFCMLV